MTKQKQNKNVKKTITFRLASWLMATVFLMTPVTGAYAQAVFPTDISEPTIVTVQNQVAVHEQAIILIFYILNSLFGNTPLTTSNDLSTIMDEFMDNTFTAFSSTLSGVDWADGSSIGTSLNSIFATDGSGEFVNVDALTDVFDNFKAGIGRVVGITTTKYTSAVQGYPAANAVCDAFMQGSYVCSSTEVLAAYQDVAPLTTGRGWINAGPPGYTADANDCSGWTSVTSPALGRIWDFAQNKGSLSQCNGTGTFAYGFVCCK